ncbi:galactokinase [Quadrisphaera granulorum]|uniref:Galactokinase n=1 Tax=Quadrisphaera granulorum TaxID=317664 RepID=A0A315ZP64_9ACTN|nr:galactokinase [Quadrisphaera granulorum]PWJ47276.1 galactokinase [Quadrisphaera granulorum]SZE98847.1 galactokinase [Quadrisphaera granulorum]
MTTTTSGAGFAGGEFAAGAAAPQGAPIWLTAAAPSAAADAAVALFAGHWEGQADGVWSAPGRVNLIGEHLDYNGGPVLPLALPHSTVAAVRARHDGVVRVVSAASSADLGGEASVWQGHLSDVGPGAPEGWAAYVAGVLWALAQAGYAVGGVDAAVVSTVPLGAGLSSSAALECVVALAVADLAVLGETSADAFRAELAAACVRAENEVARASTGGMDQAASLRCTAEHALMLDSATGAVTQVPLPLAEHGRALLVMDTRAPHRHADGEYGSRRAASERAASLLGYRLLAEAVTEAGGTAGGASAVLERLRSAAVAAREAPDRVEELVRRTRHVITETARVHQVVSLLTAAAQGSCVGVSGVGAVACIDDVGPVLSASHASMRDDYEISCPELDVVCAAAEAAGALGARMTGGGFGGSAVALVRAGTEEAVASAVRAAALAAGHPAPAFLRALASPGAHRVR